jgi:hypothetical protein
LAASGVSAQERSLRTPAAPQSLASLKATAKSAAALNPDSLGSFSTDLVYTAVTPCRIVDTRNAVGAFTAGQTRNYDLDGNGGPATTYAAQGGVATSCNIPYGTVTAAALNITVTNTTAAGFLTAWGLGARPNASVLNWAAGTTIANTTIVPNVPGISNDFSIFSNSVADVIIDVVGYFAAPSAIQLAAPIRMGSETGTSQAPTSIGGSSDETPYAGMVTRRIQTSRVTAGSVVARSPGTTLERDGTNGGFQFRIGTAGSYRMVARGTVVRANGVVASINYEAVRPTAGTLTQLINDVDDVVYFHLIFGDTPDLGNMTEVTLTRALTDYFWVGSVVTSYNQ